MSAILSLHFVVMCILLWWPVLTISSNVLYIYVLMLVLHEITWISLQILYETHDDDLRLN
jgi:hypothetical protein